VISLAFCSGLTRAKIVVAWAARSRYQKRIDGRFRYQATPPIAPAARFSAIRYTSIATFTPASDPP